MRFTQWLSNRSMLEMKDSMRQLLSKYTPLVRELLQGIGVGDDMHDNQLLGYLYHVSGFSLPTDGPAMKKQAEVMAKMVLQKLVDEVVDDVIRKKFRDDPDLQQVAKRDKSVHLSGNFHDLVATIRIKNRSFGVDVEDRFDVKTLLDGYSSDLAEFIANVATEMKTSRQSA